MSRKVWISVLLCHLFLFNVALSSSLARKKSETKEPQTTGAPTTKTTIKQTPIPATTTTEPPTKGVQDGKQENAEIRLSQRESLEKPLPKKRGVLDELYRSQPGSFDETGYDTNEDAIPDESFSSSRTDFEEKPFYKYGDSAFVTDDGYLENEGRSKRTADLDELYNRPQEHEIELTPEEMMALLNLLDESRAYGEARAKLWPYNDNTVGSIEEDMRDEDVYRDRTGSNYEGAYENGFESGARRYPAGRRRRNSLFGYQRSNVPIYRRAVF